jgi:hypothetical protein
MMKTNRYWYSNIGLVAAVAVMAALAATGPATAADWTPAYLDKSSLTAWYDAADASTITESGGVVSQWRDKSGHGRHLNQGTADYQPTTGAETRNGKKVLDFARASMAASTFDNTRNETFAIIVFNTDVAPDNADSGTTRIADITLNTATPNDARCYCGFGTAYPSDSGNMIGCKLGTSVNRYSSIAYSANTWMMYGFGRNTTDGEIWLNGTRNVLFSDLTVTSPATTQRIAFGGSEDALDRLDGQIAEVVVFSTMPTPPDRQLVEGYLAHKWGLQGDLPPSHPFYSTAPTVSSYTFDFEHPDGQGSDFFDAIPLNTLGAIRDTNGKPIGFTVNKQGVGGQEPDVELTPAGLVLDTRHATDEAARAIMLGVPFPTDGSGFVSITARYTGSFTDWNRSYEMTGILLGNADSSGIGNSISLLGAWVGTFNQLLAPDPWGSGRTDVPDYGGEMDITEMILSGPTTAGGDLWGTVTAAERHSVTQIDGFDDPEKPDKPGVEHLGEADGHAFLFANSAGTYEDVTADGFIATLKSITFRAPNLVVPASAPRGTMILFR